MKDFNLKKYLANNPLLKEDDDFINPGNPASAQAKKDDYDLDAMPPHMRDDEDWYGDDDQFDDKGADEALRDQERINDIYNEGSELLDDVGTQLEMFSEQLDENLEQLYDTSGDMTYKQQSGVLKKYFNNILRNIELTKKHLDAGF